MTKVLYPGSFDPITKGHMNIIEQASKLFDEVIVAVSYNSNKRNSFFTQEERVQMIQELYQSTENVKVLAATGATVDVALLHECKAIVRGLRSLNDFDYEQGMSEINKDISDNQVNTVCLFADKEYQFISSSVVKEVFSLDKDVSRYVHPFIKDKMLRKKDNFK